MISKGYMDLALEEARAAADRGELHVGAVIVQEGVVLATHRQNRTGNSTTSPPMPKSSPIRQAATGPGNEPPPARSLR